VYKLGARKMVVAGVGPIGCIPSQLVRQRSVNGECSDYVNSMAMDFNNGLEATIAQLNERLPGARVLYADTFAPVMDIVNNPKKYGELQTLIPKP
jgi:phospholipase/lecithinase/hemolysin